MEQQIRSKDIVLFGFSETNEENLATIVKVIGEQAGMHVLPEQINYAIIKQTMTFAFAVQDQAGVMVFTIY